MDGVGGSGRPITAKFNRVITLKYSMEPKRLHFFISRAGQDVAYATRLAGLLDRAGDQTFVQDLDIRPGHSSSTKWRDALDQVDHIVALYSTAFSTKNSR
jgi:hypothetical protein